MEKKKQNKTWVSRLFPVKWPEDRHVVIGYLVEEWRNGIIAAIKDQEQRRNFSLPEVKQLVLLCDDLLKTDKIYSNYKSKTAK